MSSPKVQIGPKKIELTGAIDFFSVVGLPQQSLEELKIHLRAGNELDTFPPQQGHVLDLVPLDSKSNPLLRDIHLFAFPEGIKVFSKPQKPISFNFVLTNVLGVRYYGATLRFSEALPFSSQNEDDNIIVSGSLVMRNSLPDDITSPSNTKLVHKRTVSLGGPNSNAPTTPTVQKTSSTSSLKNFSSLYASKCICIVSKHPYATQMKEFLMEIYNLVFVQKKSEYPIDHYITNFINQLIIVEHPLSLNFIVPLENKRLKFPSLPGSNQFPSLDISLRWLFLSLDINNVISLFCNILAEKKILLTSTHYSLLTLCGEAISCLLFPFAWHHVYIPILPDDLSGYLEAPTPFIMGINSNTLSKVTNKHELTIVDLDNNKIYADVCPIQLPEAEENLLREKLKEHAYSHIYNIDFVENREDVINLNEANNMHDKQIRIAFLLMFSSILGSYKKYYTEEALDRIEFLAEQPKSKQPFLKYFLETQAFLQFETNHNPLFDDLTKINMYPLEDQVQFLISRFHNPTTGVELSKPKRIHQSPITYDGALFPKFGIEMEKSLNTDDLINILSSYISNDGNKLEYRVLRALFLVANGQPLRSLQDFEKVLEINDRFNFPPEVVDGLVQTLEDLESKPEFYANNKAYASGIGERVRRMILDREQNKNLKRARSGSTTQAAETSESLDADEPTLNSKKEIDFINMLEDLMIPQKPNMKLDQFMTYCYDTWGYTKKISSRLFHEISPGKQIINTERLIKVLQDFQRRTLKFREEGTIDAREVCFKVSNVSNAAGERGFLILTNLRLIFTTQTSSKQQKKPPVTIKLERIVTVEKFNFIVIIPPGVPCIRVHHLVKKSSQVEKATFCILTGRSISITNELCNPLDPWARILREISIAHRIAKDTYDVNIIKHVFHRVLLSEAVEILNKKSTKAFLIYDKASTRFFTIKKILESRGPLNIIEEIVDGIGNDSPNTLSENLLVMATELFFCYVRPDGTAIDVEKLQTSKEFKKFQVATSTLKYVDVSKLTINESISFFINIFNTLSIHALLTVGFPTCKLEWKYLGRSACYDIGNFPYTLDFVQHAILRCNNPNPWVTEKQHMRYDENDPRFAQLHIPKEVDPKIHFVLALHNRSSPGIRLMRRENVDTYLTNATIEYLEQFVSVSVSRKEVVLPKMFKWYRSDFGTPIQCLQWMSPYLFGGKKKDLNILLEDYRNQMKIIFKYDWAPSPRPFR